MSPIKMHVLLEIYAFVSLDDTHYLKDTMKRRFTLIEELIRDKLVQGIIPKREGYIPYEVTRKGEVYIKAVLGTKQPRLDWVMAEEGCE